MNFKKAETPEKVVIPQKEYIQTGIELNNLRYQKQMVVDYILNHKVLDRKVVGSMLGVPMSLLERGEQL